MLFLKRFQFQDVMMFRRLNVSMFYHQHQISCVLQKLLRFVPTKMLKISFLSMNPVMLNQRGWQDYQEWKGRKVQRKSWRFFNQEGKPKISRKIFYCVRNVGCARSSNTFKLTLIFWNELINCFNSFNSILVIIQKLILNYAIFS